MPTIDQAVDYLIKNNSLELGESPWPTFEAGQDVLAIDWDQLFPKRGRAVVLENGFPNGDGWDFEPTLEELGELGNVLGIRTPDRQLQSLGQPPKWDVCAWYQPIHFFGHDWGIFIKEDCVKRAAFAIARYIDPAVKHAASHRVWFKALYRAAVYLYFLHEHYHHKIECLGFRLHVVQRKSAFLPYHKLIYAGTKGTDDQLEEALANADCYHRLNTKPYPFWITRHVVKATKNYLKCHFPHDPPGYRKAKDYLTKPRFDAGENVLQAQVKEVSLTPAQPAVDWDMAPRMTHSFFPVTSNIWTVIPAGTKSRLPLKPVAPIRTCSTRDMVALYKGVGYVEVDGGKGSHVKLKRPGAPTMILPGNRSELSPGVAKTALRVLGDFTIDDLPRLVKGELSPNSRG